MHHDRAYLGVAVCIHASARTHSRRTAYNQLQFRREFGLLLLAAELISCLAVAFGICLLAELFPQMFISMFNSDPELIEFAIPALRIYIAACGIFGAQIACQQTFLAIGNAKTSLFLALLRKIFLLIPLIYILPELIADKTSAVFLAEPIADTLAVATTVTLFALQFRKAMKGLKKD